MALACLCYPSALALLAEVPVALSVLLLAEEEPVVFLWEAVVSGLADLQLSVNLL